MTPSPSRTLFPSNNTKEAVISSTDTANPSTEVAVSPNEAGRSHLLSLLELKLPPLGFKATTPNPSNNSVDDLCLCSETLNH